MLNRMKKEYKTKNYLIYLFFLVVAILPNIIHLKTVEFVSPAIEPVNLKTGIYMDFFTQSKFTFLVLLTVLIVFMFIIYIFKVNIQINIYDCLFAFFLCFIICSVYFSEYKSIAFVGKYNRADGALFYMCLILLTYIASKIDFNNKELDTLSYALFPFLLFNVLFSYLYLNGINILNSDIFKKIFLLNSEPGAIGEGYLLSTLENPNYLSGFSCFLFSLFIARFVLLKGIRVYDGIALSLSTYLLFVSVSTSGIIATLFSVILFLFLLLLAGMELNMKAIFVKMLFAISIVFCFGVYFTNNNKRILAELTSVYEMFINNMFIAAVFFVVIFVLTFFISNHTNYKKIYLVINIIVIIAILIASFMLPYSKYYKKAYPDAVYSKEEIMDIIDNKEIKSDFLNNRLFPWQNTIDMIKDKPFFGYGLGTFAFEYNSRNIFIPTNTWTNSNVFDKPHNTFLEIAYGAGIFALSMFILIFVNLSLQFLETNKRRFDSRNLSIFIAMIAFLAQAMVNDSNVGSYPVMMIFFGILISRVQEFQDPKNMEEKLNDKKNVKYSGN